MTERRRVRTPVRIEAGTATRRRRRDEAATSWLAEAPASLLQPQAPSLQPQPGCRSRCSPHCSPSLAAAVAAAPAAPLTVVAASASLPQSLTPRQARCPHSCCSRPALQPPHALTVAAAPRCPSCNPQYFHSRCSLAGALQPPQSLHCFPSSLLTHTTGPGSEVRIEAGRMTRRGDQHWWPVAAESSSRSLQLPAAPSLAAVPRPSQKLQPPGAAAAPASLQCLKPSQSLQPPSLAVETGTDDTTAWW